MNSKIIYEKKYQHRFQEIENEATHNFSKESFPLPNVNVDDFINSLFAKSVVVLLPERVEKVPALMKMAIKIGDGCMADTTIVEYEDHFSITYALQKGEPYSELKELVAMVDEMRFRNDENSIYVSFDYYTYATYRAGKRIIPPEIT